MSHQQKSRCIRFEKRSQSRSERRRIHELLEDVKRSGEVESINHYIEEEVLRAS